MAKPVYSLLLHDQGWVKEGGSWQALVEGFAEISIYELKCFKVLYEDEAGSTAPETAEEVLIDYLTDHGHMGKR